MLAPDLPGYGRSAPPTTYALDPIADAVTESLEEHLSWPATLVGTCSGAVLATMVAQRLGARVERLILAEPFGYAPWYFRLLASRPGRFFYGCAFETPVGRFFVDRGPSARDSSASLSESFAATKPAVALGWLRALVQLGDVRLLPPPAVDAVHLLIAEKTFAAIETSIPMWTELLPIAIRHDVTGAGHLLLEDVPQAAAQLLISSGTGPAAQAATRDGSRPAARRTSQRRQPAT
ncbi:MAG: pimeloyl-ACP methyl ester carboxylesterase [Myxococcota bacterium]|jgi:pimeloyl-ACP methyl ester carboxylesterase